jgi:autotransporter-associated beta strand protein
MSARLNTGTAGGATGIVNQVNGTLNIGSQFQGANGATNSASFVSVGGGTMNIGGTNVANSFGQFYVSSRGPGVLTVSNSGAVNCGVLDVSRSISSGTPGTVNLNGGTLTVGRVGSATANATTTATGSTATFNFNGGTLAANANSTNNPATFFQGNVASPAIPITTIVKSGGAKIDDGGFAISILEPLQHDTTLGATPDGGLIKKGAGTLTLTAASTYTGNTVVSNGTLAINGSLVAASAVIVTANGTLSGIGTVGGSITVNGTIAPGTITISGLLTSLANVTINGASTMKLDKGNATNDVLSVGGNLMYGGTLNVSMLSGTPALNDSFKLFSAASFNGNFAATNLPALGSGLGWSWNPANGTLSVIPGGQTVNTNAATVNFQAAAAGGLLQFSWAPDHVGWQLYTNAAGIAATSNWFPVPGSASVTNETITINPANPNVFFQLRFP